MLDQIARHGLFDLDIEAHGDLHIDDHHTVEDTGITLGMAVAKAIGDHVAAGCPKLTQEQLETRLTACHSCPFRLGLTCRKCQCVIAIKARLLLEKCPDDPPRWPEIVDGE